MISAIGMYGGFFFSAGPDRIFSNSTFLFQLPLHTPNLVTFHSVFGKSSRWWRVDKTLKALYIIPFQYSVELEIFLKDDGHCSKAFLPSGFLRKRVTSSSRPNFKNSLPCHQFTPMEKNNVSFLRRPVVEKTVWEEWGAGKDVRWLRTTVLDYIIL